MADTSLQRHIDAGLKALHNRKDLDEMLTVLDRATVWRSLLRGVAHDLSNTSQVFTLNDPADFVDPKNADEWTDTVEWATDKLSLATIILRDFAKVQNVIEAPVLVGDVISTVAQWHRYQRSQPPVQLRFEEPNELPPVRACEPHLRQVLLALVANAKEATGDTDEADIVVAADGHDGVVSITLADNGPGIPCDLRERVFDPFFTTKGSETHLGLGATVARHLVECWGGTLSIQDGDHGRGTRLLVELREW